MKLNLIISLQLLCSFLLLNHAKAQLIRFNELQLNADTNKIDNYGKQGTWIERDTQDGEISVKQYKNNSLNGKCLTFYSNGNLRFEISYLNGGRIECEKGYTISGKLVDYIRYKGDSTIICRYDSTEKLIGKYRLIDGVEDLNYDSALYTKEFIDIFRNPKFELSSKTEYTQIPGFYFEKTYIGEKLVVVVVFFENQRVSKEEYENEILKTKTVYNKHKPNTVLSKFHYDKNKFCYLEQYWNDENIIYKTKKFKKIFGKVRIRCFKCKF